MSDRSLFLSVFYGFLVFCLVAPTLVCGQGYQAELERGKAALEAGRFDEAESILSRLISSDPQAQHYYYHGLVLGAKARMTWLLRILAAP